jgi:hypothetical protein
MFNDETRSLLKLVAVLTARTLSPEFARQQSPAHSNLQQQRCVNAIRE